MLLIPPESRPFTHGQLGLDIETLEQYKKIAITHRDAAIRGIMATIRDRKISEHGTAIVGVQTPPIMPKVRNSRETLVSAHTNFIMRRAETAVPTQVSDRLTLEQKNAFYSRYEASVMGYLLSSLYPESEIDNPEEFVRPLPEMASYALLGAALLTGDRQLLKIREDTLKNPVGVDVITPVLGLRLSEIQQEQHAA